MDGIASRIVDGMNPLAGSPAPGAAGGPAGAPRAGAAGSVHAGEPGEGPSFLAELARAMSRLEGLAGEADRMAQGLVTGQVDDISQVMIASEKARLAIELAVQLRNKAIEAYQEIMRMPL